jgi:hypothetical protein
LELFPADRFKLFHRIAFFQYKKGASSGRSFFFGKKCNSISKGFSLSSGLEIGETISFGFYDFKKIRE